MRKLIYFSVASFFAASCLMAMPARAEYVSTAYSNTNTAGYSQNQDMVTTPMNFHQSNRGISAADTIMDTNPGERAKYTNNAAAATTDTTDMTSPNATASNAMTSPNAIYQSNAANATASPEAATAPAEGTPQATASNSGGNAASSATSSNS